MLDRQRLRSQRIQDVLLPMVPVMLLGGEGCSWLLVFAQSCASTVTDSMHLALSRTREFTADLEAAGLVRGPRWRISAPWH